jgi:glutamate transport system substrate-binding protein
MTRRLLLVALLALGLAAGCDTPERLAFPQGSTMEKIQTAGTVTVGVKFDQPGIGFRNLATAKLEGFDIEIAKIVARRLGIKADRIRWTRTVSREREAYLQGDQVDFVVASFSINAERRQEVGQAGPYYVAGQQLLVRKGDDRIGGPEDLATHQVCTVTGSTSLQTLVAKYDAQTVARDTYTECVQLLLRDEVDAVSTDDAILLGYVAEQPDKLKVVGRPFTHEEYGIGYRFGDAAFCQFLTETLRLAREDGSWAAAFDRTLGKAGVPRPAPPEPMPCVEPSG